MRSAVLPCNGLDKPAGPLAREVALRIVEKSGAELICPVLLNAVPARYEKAIADCGVVVVDGCGTRCASKLAAALGLKVAHKAVITDLVKESVMEPEDDLTPGPVGVQFVKDVAAAILSQLERETAPAHQAAVEIEVPTEYLTVLHGKFVFRIPASEYYFSENDAWVRATGNRARVGVTDFVQQSLTDITFFQPVDVGKRVEQFDEIGSIESAKSMTDVLSPVSGMVVAVNTALVDSPEMINEDPYGRGWVAEVELTDFEADLEYLLDAEQYVPVVRKKAAEADI
jgi:glycine cleavage system H protein